MAKEWSYEDFLSAALKVEEALKAQGLRVFTSGRKMLFWGEANFEGRMSMTSIHFSASGSGFHVYMRFYGEPSGQAGEIKEKHDYEYSVLLFYQEEKPEDWDYQSFVDNFIAWSKEYDQAFAEVRTARD